MSLNFGVTQGADSQPNAPADMVSNMTQSQMKNFLTLKNKIIRTDELIKRHKDVLSQLTETQTRLVAMERGARGLKAELHLLHQEKRQLVASLAAIRKEVSSLRDSKREEEQLVQQLKAKLENLEMEKRHHEKNVGNVRRLMDEKEKWKSMYQKLKKDKSYRSRTNSRKNSPMSLLVSPMSPLVSPPYLPCSEELTPPTPSSLITCAVEETKNKTVVQKTSQERSPKLFAKSESRYIEHSPEDAIKATKNECVVLSMPELILPPEKSPIQTDHSPEDATEATKNKCVVLSMPEFILPSEKVPQQEVNTEKANVDSFVQDELISTRDTTDSRVQDLMVGKRPEFTDPERPITCPYICESLGSPTVAPPISLSNQLFGDSDSDYALSVSDDSSEDEHDDLAEMLNCEAAIPQNNDIANEPTSSIDMNNLTIVTVGSSADIDEVSALPMEDNRTPLYSACEGGSRDLAQYLEDCDISACEGGSRDVAQYLEDCDISVSQTVATSEAEEEHMATGHVSSMTEGSNFIVPCVEVESVAADTLSSEDEMDVSFNESSVFVLSPLPQSPIHDRSLDTPLSPLPISPTNELPLSPLPQSPIHDRSLDTPLSPLPISPTDELPLSPLPQSPIDMDAHDRSLDTPLSPLPISPTNELPLSPLPQSPIQAHDEDMTLSPLPPSPVNFRLHSGFISPLPKSPVSVPGSKVITPLPASPVSVRRLTNFTNLAPLNFADTAPCGVQVPTPCNVTVMVTSQSEDNRETTPTRSELILSDGSPFSPPPLLIDSTKDCELVSSYCEEIQNPEKATATLNLSASGDIDNGSYSSDSDKVPFIGPVLPPAHPLSSPKIPGSESVYEYQEVPEGRSEFTPGGNKGLNITSISPPRSIDSQNFSTLSVPMATSIPPNDKYKLDPSTRSVTNSQNSTNKQLPDGNTKKKKGKMNPFRKPVPENNSNSTSFDDLLQTFQQTSQVKNPEPPSNTHQHTVKQDRRSSVEGPPNSKRPRLTSSSTISSTPLLCSQLPRATSVQALPGYQGDPPTNTPSKGAPLPCYRLRSRKVDFFETVNRRKKSSSCSEDSLSNETPVCEGDCDSIDVPQGIHGDTTLSDGEVESDEEKVSTVNQKPPLVSMVTRKRRHTDGATGQEEDQTPSSSPLQLLAPPTLLQVNCGYGKQTEVSQTMAATPTQNVDDIFSTTLPLLGQSTSLATPTATPIQHIGLSVVQQQLPVWLKCPLPLPDWLVTALTALPGMKCKSHANVVNTPHVGGKKKKKRAFIVKMPLQRQSSQKPSAFIVSGLERLVLGQIYLSAIIPMFSDLNHISSSSVLITAIIEFLLCHYMPSVDVVVKLYHDQCDSVRTSPHDCRPLNPSFPPTLLKPECQLLALFAHLPRMNSNMATFLSELSTALYQAIVTPGMKFHQLAAAVRLFTGVCRLQSDSERVLFMCFDLVRKPLLVNELLVISGVASVWPLPLARCSGFRVQSDTIPKVKELEKQTLCFTLETVIMTMVKEKASHLNSSLSPHMHTLCGWVHVGDNTINLLTERLLHMLNTSSGVYIDQSPPPPSPWRRPRPSVQAFHIVHSLRLLSYSQGWVWTNDTLIRAHLWPILKKWNSSEGSEVKEAAAVCVVRLIGFVSSQGVTADPLSSSISQLQRVLIALLSKSTPGGFSALQLAAVDSLLELCPPAHPRAAETVGVVRVWLNGLCKHAVSSLAKEFNERLLVYRVGS